MNKKKLSLQTVDDEVAEILANLYDELYIYGPIYKKRKNGFNDFKGGPMKCWRHYYATSMIDNMFELGLTPNYIKSRLGHSRWQTTQDRYGNHNLGVTEEMRMERAAKVSKALGYNK